MSGTISPEKMSKLWPSLSRGRFLSIAISFYKYFAPLVLKALNKTVGIPRFPFFVVLRNNIPVFFKDRFAFITQNKFHEFNCFRIDFPAFNKHHRLFDWLI